MHLYRSKSNLALSSLLNETCISLYFLFCSKNNLSFIKNQAQRINSPNEQQQQQKLN